jgi:hypothetical protein
VVIVAVTRGRTPKDFSDHSTPKIAVHSVPVRKSHTLTFSKKTSVGASSDTTMPAVISTDSSAAATSTAWMIRSPQRAC